MLVDCLNYSYKHSEQALITLLERKSLLDKKLIFTNKIISFSTLCVSCIKAFGCCCSLVRNELWNISRDVFPN